MQYRSFISAALLCTACQHSANKTVATVVQQNDSAAVSIIASNAADTLINEEYADAWLVIADTGRDYYALRDVLLKAQQLTGNVIDSMGRSYDAEKDSVLLPVDDEDEIWAGSFYPRYSFSPDLSIEYLRIYREDCEARTLAAVSGIYATKSAADSALQVISGQWSQAHVLKSVVYLGCMH